MFFLSYFMFLSLLLKLVKLKFLLLEWFKIQTLHINIVQWQAKFNKTSEKKKKFPILFEIEISL